MTSSTKGAIIGGCLGIEGGGIFCLVLGSLEVGVQFLIYSTLGWIVGAVVRIARKEG